MLGLQPADCGIGCWAEYAIGDDAQRLLEGHDVAAAVADPQGTRQRHRPAAIVIGGRLELRGIGTMEAAAVVAILDVLPGSDRERSPERRISLDEAGKGVELAALELHGIDELVDARIAQTLPVESHDLERAPTRGLARRGPVEHFGRPHLRPGAGAR